MGLGFFMLGSIMVIAIPFLLVIIGHSTICMTIYWLIFIRVWYLALTFKDKPVTHINGHKIIGRRNWNREIILDANADYDYIKKHPTTSDGGLGRYFRIIFFLGK